MDVIAPDALTIAATAAAQWLELGGEPWMPVSVEWSRYPDDEHGAASFYVTVGRILTRDLFRANGR